MTTLSLCELVLIAGKGGKFIGFWAFGVGGDGIPLDRAALFGRAME